MTLNAGYAYRERIARAGRTVAEHLAGAHPHSSPEQWRARVEAGEVELDGRRPEPDQPLLPGQELVWHRPPWEEPEVDGRVEIIHQDEALLALAKPRGLPCLPGAGFLENTLLARARAIHPGASPMHRLGRGTSGLVLFALTAEAGSRLQEAWRARRVVKIYRALASGICVPDAFDVDAPIGPVAHPRLGQVFAASPAGKPSFTTFRVLERREDATLLEVDLGTGRPHQIRIHSAWAGHPLVGDPLYAPGGLPLPGLPGLPGDGGYWLHAGRLAFDHPVTGRPVDLRAAPPPELRTG